MSDLPPNDANLGQGYMNFLPRAWARVATEEALSYHFDDAKGRLRIRKAIKEIYGMSFGKEEPDTDIVVASSGKKKPLRTINFGEVRQALTPKPRMTDFDMPKNSVGKVSPLPDLAVILVFYGLEHVALATLQRIREPAAVWLQQACGCRFCEPQLKEYEERCQVLIGTFCAPLEGLGPEDYTILAAIEGRGFTVILHEIGVSSIPVSEEDYGQFAFCTGFATVRRAGEHLVCLRECLVQSCLPQHSWLAPVYWQGAS
ncbi:PLP-dependent transferase [Ganoderma leucocontextum]|nr:PLP-dependent transferase [Ganoderma leucocontextum]